MTQQAVLDRTGVESLVSALTDDIRQLIERATQAAAGLGPLARVTVVIGALSPVAPESLRAHWEFLSAARETAHAEPETVESDDPAGAYAHHVMLKSVTTK